MTRPQVSVIVPFYNEAEHLDACLRSILSQRGPSFELLVIDDGSDDGSDAIVHRLKGKLRSFKQDHQGPGAARNLGARQAKGAILVFVDADMSAAPGFLKAITAPILSRKEDGTFVVDELVSNPKNRWSRSWSLAHGLPPERRLHEDMPRRAGIYRAIRRDKFLKAGGQHEERGVGEDEMAHPGLKSALAVPGAVLYHANPGSALEVWLSARWSGRGRAVWVDTWEFWRLALTHSLPRSLLAAIWGGLKHRSLFFVAFKLYFDAAVFTGLWQGRLFGVKAR